VTYDEVGLVSCLTLSWGSVFRQGAFRGARGKYTKRYHAGTNLVLFDPDVQKAFRSERAVNEASRLVIELRILGSYKRRAERRCRLSDGFYRRFFP
jgi:hypothetical protein